MRCGCNPGVAPVPAPECIEIRIRDKVAVAQEDIIVRLSVRDRGDQRVDEGNIAVTGFGFWLLYDRLVSVCAQGLLYVYFFIFNIDILILESERFSAPKAAVEQDIGEQAHDRVIEMRTDCCHIGF